jgi:hypothetical protein
VQLHARKTPLADDVNFPALAERYARSGGDIKNAVLKAAQIATLEPGPDSDKRIHQRHFVQGMEEVIAAENVMSQSLFEDARLAGGVAESLAETQESIRGEVALLTERFDGIERSIRKVASEQSAGRTELERQQAALLESLALERRRRDRILFLSTAGAAIAALAALALSIFG